ncbi:hypothetical protein K9M50_01380 [Patescibacteria group bacterium]|nr:hypothetical protein [Patescibacteria group bacterium]
MNIKNKFKKSFIFPIILIFAFSFLVFNVSLAQETKEPANLEDFKNIRLETSVDSAETVNKLQVFWHDLKDTINLALTFDKTKKLEKELKYAEKRIRWANKLSTFTSQDKKDLAFDLSAKADEYVNDIVDKSDIVFTDIDEKKESILENILIHQENKAKVWENLEYDIDVGNSEDFMRIRDQIESKQQNFMEKVADNNKIPRELRERFQNQAQKTKQKRENRRNFVERNREQLNNLNDSQDSDLKEFLEKRRQDMMHFNEEFQEEFKDNNNGNKQNRNNQTEDRGQNHLQSENTNDDSNNTGSVKANNNRDNNINIPEIDLDSPEYQEFLRMIDSRQSASADMEIEE